MLLTNTHARTVKQIKQECAESKNGFFFRRGWANRGGRRNKVRGKKGCGLETGLRPEADDDGEKRRESVAEGNLQRGATL